MSRSSMKSKVLIILLVVLAPIHSSKDALDSSHPSGHRDPRFLFSIVSFRNEQCSSPSSSSSSILDVGLCYTHAECSQLGGTATVSCAAGFGTCCIFRKSCGDRSSERVTYFSNPAYPRLELESRVCEYNLDVTDLDVCQVRLDFELFQMEGPSLSKAPYGRCDGDRMAFITNVGNLGLSEGNLLCGTNDGQHIYLPVVRSEGEVSGTIRLFVVLSNGVSGRRSPYGWNIRAQMIDCNNNDPLRAPDGCLQYMRSMRGSLRSFNQALEMSPYPIEMDYAICFRKSAAICGLQLTMTTTNDNLQLNNNDADPHEGWDPNCSMSPNSRNFNEDFLQIIGDAISMESDQAVEYSGRVSTRFCGVFPALDPNFTGIRATFPGPLIVRVHSDDSVRVRSSGNLPISPDHAKQIVADGVENGFKLTYELIDNC